MKTNPVKILTYLVALGLGVAAGFWWGTNYFAPAATTTGAAGQNHAGSTAGGASYRSGSGAAYGAGTSLESLLRGPGKPDPLLLALWAKGLSPAECAAALSSLKGLPANAMRDAVMDAVVTNWATRDPKGFLAAANGVPTPHVREDGTDAALKAWAASDPKAALDWFKDNPGDASSPALQKRYAAAMAGYAATDPAGAFNTASALGEDNLRDRQMKSTALNAISDSLADQGKFSDALSLFGQLPAGTTQTTALAHLAQDWAASSPTDAAVWAANITDSATRAQVSLQVAQTWAVSDPASAAAWAAQADAANAAGNTTGAQNTGPLLANVIRTWANDDIDAPGQFLNQLPASPTKDSAVAIFAMRAAQEDPAGAVQWVGSISNDQMRQGVAGMVAFNMLQQDPAAFNTFVNNTTLLSDQQKQMLQNIPPQAVERMNQFNNMMGGGNAMQTMMENMMINGGGPFGGRGFGGGGGRGGFGGGGGGGGGGGYGGGGYGGGPGGPPGGGGGPPGGGN
jgi:hypothetical protein